MDPTPPSSRTNVPDLVLSGAPLELTLPDVCARCGAPAHQRLSWECVFVEHDDDGYTNRIIGVRAPFCAQCLALHEREAKPMPAWRRVLQCFRSEMMIPSVLSGVFGIWLFTKLLPKTPQVRDWVDWAVPAGVLIFFALISIGSYWAARDATRHYTVSPLTSVTASFGFHTISGELFEGERYRYTIANQVFYDALLAANESRVWRASGDHARAAANKRVALYVLLGVVVLVALSWDWLAQLKPWEW